MRARDYFFSFTGRINRARWWLFLAIVTPSLMFMLMAFWTYALSIPGAYENGGPTPWPSDPVGIVGAILFFAVLFSIFVAALAVTVKRLHDRDKAWWWIAIFVFVPDLMFAGAFSKAVTIGGANMSDALRVAGFAAAALYLWGFVELACLPGTRGVNRFGPDTLAL